MARQRRSVWVPFVLFLTAVAFRTQGPWAGASGDSPPISGEVRKDYPREWKAFQRWAAANLLVRRTTQEEVVAIFGPDYVNLDRPRRDGIITLQYPVRKLKINAPADYLLFDFDSRNRVLNDDMSLSSWVCGFCPHVFADDG